MYEALRLKFLGNFHRVFPPSHITEIYSLIVFSRRLLHCRKKNAKININWRVTDFSGTILILNLFLLSLA